MAHKSMCSHISFTPFHFLPISTPFFIDIFLPDELRWGHGYKYSGLVISTLVQTLHQTLLFLVQGNSGKYELDSLTTVTRHLGIWFTPSWRDSPRASRIYQMLNFSIRCSMNICFLLVGITIYTFPLIIHHIEISPHPTQHKNYITRHST